MRQIKQDTIVAGFDKDQHAELDAWNKLTQEQRDERDEFEARKLVHDKEAAMIKLADERLAELHRQGKEDEASAAKKQADLDQIVKEQKADMKAQAERMAAAKGDGKTGKPVVKDLDDETIKKFAQDKLDEKKRKEEEAAKLTEKDLAEKLAADKLAAEKVKEEADAKLGAEKAEAKKAEKAAADKLAEEKEVARVEKEKVDQKLAEEKLAAEKEADKVAAEVKLAAEKEAARIEKEKIDQKVADEKKSAEEEKKAAAAQLAGEKKETKEEEKAAAAKLKVPTFDEDISWELYKSQFEKAAAFDGWSEEVKVVILRANPKEVLQLAYPETTVSLTVEQATLEEILESTIKSKYHAAKL
jgi:hypothetical protein